MTHQTEIRRRPDGSIDTAYHMAQGRIARSRAAREAGSGLADKGRGPVALLIALLALMPVFGGRA
ncbi:hypothetical protein [Psychromarinibacter halotolerans]|uniref:Uncharacterized protein n=1 Tax=Psychromarinibacter halotolerans TaxID=1775175 RepID=A0ABV7GPC2_9RHOB|nr:hypothetical protein [Psychromarinibacter halotolerans]MDF0594516.1 hypothetical protein [Psychromarinibacter halotolerans]